MAAPNGLIVAWPSTAASIPAGWSRYAALNDSVPKPAAASIGTTGGSDTHVHSVASHTHTDSHSHAAVTSGSPSTTTNVIGDFANTRPHNTHTHTGTPGVPGTTQTSSAASPTSASDTSLGFSRVSVIWIQSDGTTDIPTNAVAYSSQASTPLGWSAYANGINAYLRGAAVGADGGTVTAAAGHSSHSASHTHTHSSTAHTHVSSSSAGASGTVIIQLTGATSVNDFHGHTVSWGSAGHTAQTSGSSAATASSTTVDLSFYKLQTIQASGSAPAPPGIIALWTTTTPPSGWAACDGNTGTPALNSSGRYIKGANGVGEIGSTGGSNTHVHTAASGHTHTGSGTAGGGTHAATWGTPDAAATTNASGGAGNVYGSSTHTHTSGDAGSARTSATLSATNADFDSATHEPAYVNMFFIMSLAALAGKAWWRTPKFNYTLR